MADNNNSDDEGVKNETIYMLKFQFRSVIWMKLNGTIMN